MTTLSSKGIKTLTFILRHSKNKWNDSIEGSLDRVLFEGDPGFPKSLMPRIPQNTSNINTECAGKPK